MKPGSCAADLVVRPATPELVEDVIAVFSDCSYGRKCWCAYWTLPRREFKANWGEGNRQQLLDRIMNGSQPGIVGYVDDEPAAWLSIAPRDRFDLLNRSKSLAALPGQDPSQVWAMNCFITVKRHRRSGIMRAMIEAGVRFIRERGGRIAEAYPFDGNRRPLVDELFIGTGNAFRDCGFVELERRLPSRPIMQRLIRE